MSHFFAASTRRLIVLLGVFFAFAQLTACSSQKPENVVKDYLQAVAENRFTDAIGYFSLKGVKENELMAIEEELLQLIDQQYQIIQENGGMESLSLTFGDKNDDIAHAKIEVKFMNGNMEKNQLTLVNESGAWKIKLHADQAGDR